jgi:hypothetical protein
MSTGNISKENARKCHFYFSMQSGNLGIEFGDGAVEKGDLGLWRVSGGIPDYDNVKGENPLRSIIRSCW